MKWQAYAERLEADLKMTDETLKTLKQENRDLQKKLIAAPTDVDAQMQLEKIKQEAKSYADSHVQKANDLQQQLVVAQHVRDAAITRATEAETGQQNVLEKLDAASHELEAKDAEIEQLRNELAAHTPSLLRAQQTFEAAKQKWEAAAESYEQRTKVLADQLQRQQKENARLLGLKEKKKPGQADEDEDDSEPEFPGHPPSSAPKPPTFQPTASKLPTQQRPQPAATPLAGPLPKPALPLKTNSAPKPATFPKTTSTKTAHTAKGSASDNRAAACKKPRPQPAINLRLPIRKSVHDNINVADHSPPSPISSTSEPKKRKHNGSDTVNGAQRKRSKQELERDELGDELNALKIDGFGYSAAIAAGPRAKRTSTASTQSATATDGALPNASTGFDFRAICTYRDRDTIGDEMHSSKLTDVAADLWDRIESAQNIWEKSWGAEWREELMRHCARVPDKYVCVTRLLLRKRTNWGSGREPGMFACVDCVRAGLPCFTHVWQDASSEIQLLPLHEKERGGPVIKGEEVMWWIKRGVGMPESDGEM